MQKYKWPLSVDSLRFIDRLKIAAFLLNRKNRLTADKNVLKFEKELSEYSGSKALLTSSGSTADELMFYTYRLKYPKRTNTLVIVPSTTWSSTVSIPIMLGFKVKFCDVNLQDLSFDYDQLERICKENRRKPLIIFATSLIGLSPDLKRLDSIAKTYRAELYLDACESVLTKDKNKSILGSCDMVSTSFYFSHIISSSECGALFCRNESSYMAAKMARAHGLSRVLDKNDLVEGMHRDYIEKSNKDIDPQFLFAVLGNNFRAQEFTALVGLYDWRKREAYLSQRIDLYDGWFTLLDNGKYYVPQLKGGDCPFCLPIILSKFNAYPSEMMQNIKTLLRSEQVEYRPFIAGCLTCHPAFKDYGDPKETPNSLFLHKNALYIGLHSGVTINQVRELTQKLNEL